MRMARGRWFAAAACVTTMAVLASDLASPQSRTPEERRAARGLPPEANIPLAPGLSFGAKIEIESELRSNLDLSSRDADTLLLAVPELSLALSLDPSPRFQAFVDIAFSGELTAFAGGVRLDLLAELELVEAFVWFKQVAGRRLSVQIGRQQFRDDREWLYDEELDAVRVRYGADRFDVELSISRNGLVQKDLLADECDGDRINNYLVYAGYRLTDRIDIGAYLFVRDDRSSDRESSIFLGVRSRGELIRRLDHWLELAYVTGRDGSRRISGTGFDVGLTYELDRPLRPSLTAGYAFGSRNFRQTGLQDNEGRFNGVTRFRYYGELFDPELSNFLILTHGIGIRPTRRTSVNLVHHYYFQPRASSFILDAAIDADPSGRSRDLGHEIDGIFGYRIRRNMDMILTLGWFIPGRAFPGGDNALVAFFAMAYTFP
jgi:alginate production protein